VSRILVTVGTDHHPFQRLVDWADGFARQHPEHELFIQYGSARPPASGSSSRLLDHAQLQTEIARADAVVCHGGPATITDIRRSGLSPICVPRDPRRGEHVDEHQQRFARHIGQAGLVTVCENVDELDALVTQALSQPRRSAAETDTAPEGVQRVAELIAALEPSPAASSVDQPLRVVYIGGQGRSGSTLIERALGELPGVVGVGETVHLWERGLGADELCGCGQPFSRCAFWTAVGEQAFGGWEHVDDSTTLDLRVDRNRYLPLLLRPGLLPSFQRRHIQQVDRLARLYRAIASVSGASTIIDSSKHGSYAMLLSSIPGIDLRVLHVVRDSRAVAHAWTKSVPRPEADGAPMPVYSPSKAAALWDLENLVVEQLGRQHPYLRVRYEDFTEAPKDVLTAAARLAGVDETSVLEVLDGETLHVGSSHTVAGNPMRFTSGDITIRRDQSWRAEMPTRRRRFVGALTAPLQRHYGYRGETR
jgi:UDP-N-acetylglucosamine transferase subunit ALG13